MREFKTADVFWPLVHFISLPAEWWNNQLKSEPSLITIDPTRFKVTNCRYCRLFSTSQRAKMAKANKKGHGARPFLNSCQIAAKM